MPGARGNRSDTTARRSFAERFLVAGEGSVSARFSDRGVQQGAADKFGAPGWLVERTSSKVSKPLKMSSRRTNFWILPEAPTERGSRVRRPGRRAGHEPR